jgi:cyanophycinase
MAKKKTNEKQTHHDAEQTQLPAPKGILIAIGGKENKGETPEIDSSQEGNSNFEQYGILRRFVQELWGEEPLIVIIPTASGEPEKSAKDYVAVFRHLKFSNVEIADIRTRADTMKAENLELIRKAGGIMFTGGDQLKLTAIFGGTEFLDILKDRYTNNKIVIAGTSAGATALSTPMIFEGGAKNSGFLKGQLQITTGLEFLKDVAIDTHFVARGRIVRMAQMVAMNPGAIGIGLEEDTAIVVTDGKDLEVIGSGIVTVVDGHPSTYTNIYEIKDGEPVTVCDLKVHFLSRGQRYCINKREQTYK